MQIFYMVLDHGVRRALNGTRAVQPQALSRGRRPVHSDSSAHRNPAFDSRNRLSNFWTPALKKSPSDVSNESHQLLVRAGFLRQAHSGIFHLLPLGLRVQDKIERLIDRHMASLGASKVSLSSISSQDLWQQSGRLEGRNSEFFKLEDRKGHKYLLSPTHEEEITNIVANAVHSYKDLPLRLYQVSRKYRDEFRPRQGLLRGREFVMKDLYTFDLTDTDARATYEQVRAVYRAFLDDLGIPYIVAEADSGNMGGKLSHEYHFLSSSGEDSIISCDQCDLTLNVELYTGHQNTGQFVPRSEMEHLYQHVECGRTHDGKTSVIACLPSQDSSGPIRLNMHAIKHVVDDLNTNASANEDLSPTPTKRLVLVDPRLNLTDIEEEFQQTLTRVPTRVLQTENLLSQLRESDPCPKCEAGTVKLSPAMEIGHTFHLGKRYSVPLNANVLDASNTQISVEMGCHGIGVSRLIGAVAALLSDSKGLNWPLSIAPFSILIVASNSTDPQAIASIYDEVTSRSPLDVAIDDRDRPFGWKLNDADLIGYPFIVVLGKAWSLRGAVEIQCRRLNVKEEISVDSLCTVLARYAAQL